MNTDHTLLNKYNTPVPRYTSYPPANHFTTQLTSEEYTGLIESSNSWNPHHIAFYVHIPFCKKICFYCGCNACKLNANSEVEEYIAALKKEILLASKFISKERLVTQVHFGGGTPNAIPAEMLTEIVGLFRSLFRFSENAEIAVETNPAYLDTEYLDALIAAGFNRYSFGIQDFNKAVLKLVNREPSAMPVSALMDYMRSCAPEAAVNLDFIYGLPGQSVAGFSATMEEAASLHPDRLVTFSYAHVPWLKKHQQILEKRGLPGPEEKNAMFLAGYEVLKTAGYQPIGLDHFVTKEDELFQALKKRRLHRNFQGYCTRETTGQVYAFGVSAISQLERGYIQNTKSTERYIKEIKEGKLPVENGMIITDNQIVIREVITQLMCNKQIAWDSLANTLAIPVEELKSTIRFDPDKLGELERDGLIELTGKSLTVTETGSLFIRNIAATLDPAFSEQANKYSKSV